MQSKTTLDASGLERRGLAALAIFVAYCECELVIQIEGK